MGHGHDEFDGEPAHELGPDEPRTPGWVPAVGLALFLCAAIALLASSKDAGAGTTAAPPPPTPVAATPPAKPDVPVKTQPVGSVPMRSPEQLAEIRKRIEELQRSRAGASGAPMAPPPPRKAPPGPAPAH